MIASGGHVTRDAHAVAEEAQTRAGACGDEVGHARAGPEADLDL